MSQNPGDHKFPEFHRLPALPVEELIRLIRLLFDEQVSKEQFLEEAKRVAEVLKK